MVWLVALLFVFGLMLFVQAGEIAEYSRWKMGRSPAWCKALFGDGQSEEYLQGTRLLWRVAGGLFIAFSVFVSCKVVLDRGS